MSIISFTGSLCKIFTIIMSLLLKHCYASNNGLVLINQCPCQNQDQVYQCTIIGRGATVWRGTAFNCPPVNNKITLFHSINSTAREVCNDGEISATFVKAENNCYISQLNIRPNLAINSRNIACAHDNGSVITVVGSSILTINTEPYPSPSDVRLIEASFEQLTFQWSPIISTCDSVSYGIAAVNCGNCPITTEHITAFCTNFVINNNNNCRFAVRTVACGNVFGDLSQEISVSLTVPAAPKVSVTPIYSHITQHLSGLMTIFNKEENFNISNGIDGSAFSYTVNYTESGTSNHCASATVPASSCVNDVCKHVFEVSSSLCSTMSRIVVTVYGNSRLGKGASSTPVSITETINNFVSLSFDADINRLTCKFLQHQESAFADYTCSIVYGSIEENCRALSLTSISNNTTLYMGLFLSKNTESQNKKCFTVTASNGSYVVIVEGSFITDCGPSLLSDGTQPTSDSANCQQPLITHSFGIRDGIICYTGTAVGSAVYYYCLMCDKTTIITPSISNRTCMADGNWSGTIPKCQCVSESLPFVISGTSFGVSTAILCVLIVVITTILTTVIIILWYSRRAIQVQLIQAKAIQPATIYEDIETIPLPPLPIIDIETNTAYIISASESKEDKCDND